MYCKQLLLMLRRFNYTQHNSTALEQMCPCQYHLGTRCSLPHTSVPVSTFIFTPSSHLLPSPPSLSPHLSHLFLMPLFKRRGCDRQERRESGVNEQGKTTEEEENGR